MGSSVDDILMENKKANGHHKEESIIQFPCDFVLKIMGKSEGSFEKIALAIVRSHYSDLIKIEKKLSKNQKYLSLSITIHAKNKAELDALYRELSSNKEILMVL